MSKSKKPGGREATEVPALLWGQLVEAQQQLLNEQGGAGSVEVTVLLCGRKRSGKTSAVDRFINPTKDASDVPRPTVAFDYKYARQQGGAQGTGAAAEDAAGGQSGLASRVGNKKTVAHFFDLGGDERLSELLGVALGAGQSGGAVAVICVDCSDPSTALSSLQFWANAVKTHVARLPKPPPPHPCAPSAVYSAHADVLQGGVSAGGLMPVPTVVLATKWDLLSEQIDPERRKWLCRGLRYFCHSLGASLVSTSTKDKASLATMRAVMKQLLFGGPPLKPSSEQRDHNKPLVVPAGRDSLDSIELPKSAGSQSDATWLRIAADMFPPDPKARAADTQAAVDLARYPEPAVDGMAEQKSDELAAYIRQAELQRKLASEGADTLRSAN